MLFSLVKQVQAQCAPGNDGLNLGDCITLDGTEKVSTYYNDPNDLINLIVRNLFVIAGVILFVLIFYSGYLFISGGTKGKDEAKTMITTAATGFIIMFVAYWIVQMIEYVIGMQII